MSRTALVAIIVLGSVFPALAQDWDQDKAPLETMQRENRWDDVLRLAAELLGKYRDDAQVLRLYEWRVTAYESAKRWDAMTTEAEGLDKAAVGAKKPLLAQVLSHYASRLQANQKGDLAIRVYRSLLERCPAESERCAWARMGIGDCLLWHVKDAQERALGEYLAVERNYPAETKAVVAAAVRVADYGGSMKDIRAAADACDKLLHRFPGQCDADTLERVAVKYGEYLAQSEQWDGALKAYREAEEKFVKREAMLSDLAWREAAILQDRLHAEGAVPALQRVLASYGLSSPDRCADAARRLVSVHLAAKRYAEAAKAARICMDTGDEDWALPQMVECLRGIDPTEAKLQAFLLREIDGANAQLAGRPVDDVLAGIGYPDYPPEVEKAFDQSLGGLDSDWRSLWRKGRLCLYRGKPREAAAHLYRAFLLCPGLQELQRIRIALVRDAYHGVYGTHVGAARWQRRLCPAPDNAEPDTETPALLAYSPPKPDTSADVNDALAALESCLREPFPTGVNPQTVAHDRQVFVDAYVRVAAEKGRTDDLIRFCLAEMEKEKLAGLFDAFVEAGALACRLRDGHAAGEIAFLEDLTNPAKTPGVAQRARHVAQTRLNPFRQLRANPPFNPQVYRKYLPRKRP